MKTTLKFNTSVLRWAGCLALVATLAACGGGGGGGGGVAVPDPIPDPINNANAVDDTFPAIQSASGGSTTAVQLNDTVTINSTTTSAVLGTNASIAAVTRTSAAPAAGSISFNTSTGVITVAAGTSAGAYAFSYQLCRTAPNLTLCDVATASGSVTATPPASDIVTRADINACPEVLSPIGSTNWSSCLAGKRFVGRDTFATSQVCELRFLANGGVEYIHNGITYTPEVNGPALLGAYAHDRGDQFLGSLGWNASNSATVKISDIDVLIRLTAVLGPSSIEVDYFDVTATRRVLNCTPNPI